MIEIKRQRVIRRQYVVDAAAGKNVLDIGCVGSDGLMDLHKSVRAAAARCTGLDLSPADGVVVGDAQNFDFPEPFDLIVAGEIIEHLPNVRGFADSVARNLKSGGRLILTTPNPYSALALSKAARAEPVPNDRFHISLFDATTLAHWWGNYLGEGAEGSLMYYEEDGTATLPYRLNRFVSRLIPAYSVGLLLDLKWPAGRERLT